MIDMGIKIGYDKLKHAYMVTPYKDFDICLYATTKEELWHIMELQRLLIEMKND